MKIAAITEDGKTISQHFGRAPYYMVVTVTGGQITEREMRDKLGHAQFQENHPQHEEQKAPHGFGADAQDRHTRMAQAISDCEVLLCGGMGSGAYESMQARGIRPVVTDIPNIDQAVRAYLEGRIVDHIERLH